MSNTSKYLYGLLHFEDGFRPVIMKRGTKQFFSYFIDGATIVRRYVLFKEEKYFQEYANSDENLKEIKRVARVMLNRSKVSGLKREMTMATRKALNEVLEYQNEMS